MKILQVNDIVRVNGKLAKVVKLDWEHALDCPGQCGPKQKRRMCMPVILIEIANLK